MQIAFIVASRTAVMLFYMILGALLFRVGKIGVAGSKDLASLLVWVVIPAVVFNSFCVERTDERTQAFVQSLLLGATALAVSISIGRLLFARRPIENFSAAFSNAGFIGVPLVSAALGGDAVFYLVGYIAVLNVLQWTYGVGVLTGGASGTGLGPLLLNPIMLAALAGAAVYLFGLGAALPQVVTSVAGGLASTNAPLAMLVMGTYMAQVDLRELFTNARLYLLSAVRLVVAPLVTWALFTLLPGAVDVKLALLVAAAAPVGANVAVYAQLYGLDYARACQGVVLSTLLSVVSLPLLLFVLA